MSVHASIVIDSDQHFEVATHDSPPHRYQPEGGHIAAVRLQGGLGGAITIQGDPEPMLALFDRIRSELIAAIGKAWPTEMAHAPEQVGV